MIPLFGLGPTWVLNFSRSLLATLVCAVFIAGVNGQKVSFPSAKSETMSPDGRYTIRNTDDVKEEPAHTLTLVDARDGSETKIYSYGRHVDVLWSPASNAFVVNDYEGSDASHPVLFTAPWAGPSVDLRGQLTDFLRSQGKAKRVEENHHVYFSAQRWFNGNEILCKVTGYGEADPKGYTQHYVYKIGGGFRLHR